MSCRCPTCAATPTDTNRTYWTLVYGRVINLEESA